MRTPLGGAVEAIVGRLITPLILGTPTEDGKLVLSQHVISGKKQVNLPFATLGAAGRRRNPGGKSAMVRSGCLVPRW